MSDNPVDPTNDGVQYARSHRRWFYWDGTMAENNPDRYCRWEDNRSYWLPPLYPYTWTIWRDHASCDVCIAIHIPRKSSDDEKWVPIASGTFKEMWPLFLTYVTLVWEPAYGS